MLLLGTDSDKNQLSKGQKMKIGINGFGRIGRALLRLSHESNRHEQLQIVAVNSRSSLKMACHLLKYDSVHGVYKKPVIATDKGIKVGKQEVIYCSHSHPSEIPWDKWNVDLVLECSGAFKKREDLEQHFKPGVKRVLVSAPIKSADFTLIYGVNHQDFQPEKHKIISLGSCTTNCLSPLIQVLDRHFKIQDLMFTTVHAYTQDQKLLDSAHKKDVRRARSAGLSIIPTTTGAEESLSLIFPWLKGRIKGGALRVPTANVSLVDMVLRLKKPAHRDSIHQAFQKAEAGELKGILACEKEELVSVDFNGSLSSAIVDLSSTRVTEEGLVKILAWYDNETGFSGRLLDFALKLS